MVLRQTGGPRMQLCVHGIKIVETPDSGTPSLAVRLRLVPEG